MTQEFEDSLRSTLEKIGLALFVIIGWHVVFWYFLLPDWPLTFKNEVGEWMCHNKIFPYKSSTPFDELPAIMQQIYLLGFVLIYGGIRIFTWLFTQLFLFIFWVRDLF
jgi:hypothetical protein